VWTCLKAPVDVVLLDEPTNNVDPPGVRYLQQQIAAMKATHAMLVISHDHAFLDGIGTRTLVLGT